ncbi:MAG: hypothetical protein ACLU9S_05790 [Oscillospiraceae bacterium]
MRHISQAGDGHQRLSVEEYAEVCQKLDAQEQIGWLEVNICRPNVHGGGVLAFGADPKPPRPR